MKMLKTISNKTLLLSVVLSGFFLAACQSNPKIDSSLSESRNNLEKLQQDSQLADLASAAIQEADEALDAAENAKGSEDLKNHLAYVAKQKVATAQAKAETRYAENRLDSLTKEREQAQRNALVREAQTAKQRVTQLESELSSMQQKETDRGTVFVLNDALFETGKAELKAGAKSNFQRLAKFMMDRPNQDIVVEGHTDSTGSDEYNQTLSQQRADAVKDFLITSGVPAERISAVGKGEGYPVATNDTSSGRQQNRRVEVIVENVQRGASR